MCRNWEEEYEEYNDEFTYEKIHRKGKIKQKGHQSRHQQKESEIWNEIIDSSDDYTPFTPIVEPAVASKPESKSYQREEFKGHQFGENTREVKGVKIDYDGVRDMEKVESMHEGHKTYGIKYTFKGLKGSTRTIWYNQRQRERDMVYEQEKNYWDNLLSTNY